MKSSERDDTPVLITEAAPSHDDQHAARKRKYVIMMVLRVPLLVLGLVLALSSTWWLGLAVVVLSIPLPWAAVLIANDRPPRKAESVNRYQRSPRAIEGGNHQVIDG